MNASTAHLPLLIAALVCAIAGRGSRREVTCRVRPTSADAAALLAAEAAAWGDAEAVHWGPPGYLTSFRALRDADALWLRFDAVDPSPWHTLESRDDPLWEEEVVEIFIDPDGDGRGYYELEISPANVVADLLVFEGWPDVRSDITWRFSGLSTHVVPLREAGATTGWTAVARLPWTGFVALPGTPALPPAAGDVWRFNVFRIKRPHGPQDPERDLVLAAWSPVPGVSFHVPAVFRAMQFVE